jgi:hypothetical protein
MQQIRSSIDINASAALVWAILTDFATYKRWNPFIRAVLGKPSTGSTLRITLQSQSQPVESITSRLTQVREPRDLRWRHWHVAPGLYTTERLFRIEPLPAGGVRFHQTAQIKGLFSLLLRRDTRRTAEEDFHAMNHALKLHAERMNASLAAAGSPTS